MLRLRIDRGEREVAARHAGDRRHGPGRPHRQGVRRLRRRHAGQRSRSRDRGRGQAHRRAAACSIGLGQPDSYACTIDVRSSSQRKPERASQVGDEIVTSGVGAMFPPGLVVGKVSKLDGDDGMFQKVEVAPAVDVSRVRAVDGAARAAAAAGSRRQDQEAQRAGVRSARAVRTATASSSSRTSLCVDRRVRVVAARCRSRSLRDAVPDIGALTAAYLGLTARRALAPARRRLGRARLPRRRHQRRAAGPDARSCSASTCLVARSVQQRIARARRGDDDRRSRRSSRWSRRRSRCSCAALVRMPRAPFSLELQAHRAGRVRDRRSSARWCGACSAASTPRSRAPIASAMPRSKGWQP